MNPAPPAQTIFFGRVFYGTAIIFFGIVHLVSGKFLTRAMPPWPSWLPMPELWAYGMGLGFLAAGITILTKRFAHRVAMGLGFGILIGVVLLALPMAMKRAAWGAEWTFAGKGFALAGGAFVVADYIATRFNQPRSAWVLPLGTTCLGGFLILGGIQHFIWPKFVAQLVPAWIPGATFWTYFSAGALIAGGIGILIPRTARSAATLVALMIFSWVVILHIPRAWTTSPSLNEWLAAFEALAMSGTAWLIAGANRRTIGD